MYSAATCARTPNAVAFAPRTDVSLALAHSAPISGRTIKPSVSQYSIRDESKALPRRSGGQMRSEGFCRDPSVDKGSLR